MKKLLLSLALICGIASQGYATKYELVTDVSNLKDGLKVIIVNTANNKALGTTQNTNNRAAVDVVISNNVIDPGTDVQVIELIKSGDNYSLCVGESQYLYAASSSSNHLRTQTTPVPATITIANSNATIEFTGSNSHNLLKYNNSSKIFSCYSSTTTQLDVQIYAAQESTNPADYKTGLDNAITLEVGQTAKIADGVPDDFEAEITKGNDVISYVNGVITATAAGEAELYFLWANAACDQTITVTVTTPKIDPEISFASDALTYILGTDVEVNGTVDGQKLNAPVGCTVSYESDNTKVVTVAEDGRLTIAGAGKATITATVAEDETYNTASKSYTVTVIDPNVITYTDVLKIGGDCFDATGSYAVCNFTSTITGIEYLGNMANGNGKDAIQLRTTNSNSGIVVSTNQNGYLLREISVVWHDGTDDARKIDIYGKNTAYTAATDLYTDQGEKIGTIEKSNNQTITVDTDYQYIGVRSNYGTLYLTSVTLVWEKVNVDPDAIAAPVITADKNKISLTCATEGAEIRYTTDGTPATAESTLYDEPFDIWEPTTINAIAVKDGKTSEAVSRTFNMYVLDDFSMLSDITGDMFNCEYVITCPMTVLYQAANKKRMYVRSGYSNMFVYSDNAMAEYNVGDVIDGAYGKFEYFKGLLEFKPTSLGEVTGTAAVPEPYIISAEDIQQNMINQYVKLLDVTIALVEKSSYIVTTADGQTVACYNSNYITVPTDDKRYDIIGFIGIYSTDTETTMQIIPTEIVEHAVPEIPTLHADTPWPSNNKLEAGQQLKYVVTNGFIYVRIVETPANAPMHVAATVFEQGEAPANWEYPDTKTAVYTHPADVTSMPVYEVVNVVNEEEGAPLSLEFSADGSVSGVADVAVDGEAAEYYNLQGVRVENPESGLYIRRQGNTFTKVLVK